MGRKAAIWLLLALGAGLAVVAVGRPHLITSPQAPWALYSVLLLVYLLSTGWVYFRADPGATVRNIAIWLAVAVVIAAGYRLWQGATG